MGITYELTLLAYHDDLNKILGKNEIYISMKYRLKIYMGKLTSVLKLKARVTFSIVKKYIINVKIRCHLRIDQTSACNF